MKGETLTLLEAFDREMERGLSLIASTQPAPCHRCGKTGELRAGACFECKDDVRTDMIDVWDVNDPSKRWPYQWRGEPFEDITDDQAAKLQRAVDQHLGSVGGE